MKCHSWQQRFGGFQPALGNPGCMWQSGGTQEQFADWLHLH
jgi:hypothetical protein